MENNLPLHPMLVHFPIAFFILEFVFLSFWIFKNDDSYKKFALFVFRFGFLILLAAVYEGLEEAGGFSGIKGKIAPHFYAASAFFLITLARGIYWQFGNAHHEKNKWVLLASSILGSLALMATGYFGGLIVYSS